MHSQSLALGPMCPGLVLHDSLSSFPSLPGIPPSYFFIPFVDPYHLYFFDFLPLGPVMG